MFTFTPKPPPLNGLMIILLYLTQKKNNENK